MIERHVSEWPEKPSAAGQRSTRELIRKIRRIEIFTNRLVNAQIAGQYHSVFKGRGMAFSEVRQYLPGDDVRLIDWNVSARFNDAFIKVFTEEREVTFMLLVDMSASMFVGTTEQTKREIVAELAAIMAFSAIKNNDRVGLIIFTDSVERFVPPKKGRKHVLRVISEILSYEPQRCETSLLAGLQFLGHVTKRRSIVFLLTDFLGSSSLTANDGEGPFGEEKLEQLIRVTARKHDLIPVSISDPIETELPEFGLVQFIDMETGMPTVVDATGRAARIYAKRVRALQAAREVFFKRINVECLQLETNRPYVSRLAEFFRQRQLRFRQ